LFLIIEKKKERKDSWFEICFKLNQTAEWWWWWWRRRRKE